MEKIDLSDFKERAYKVADEIFYKLTLLPPHIRSDDKERTGIQILLRELNTKNLELISIGEPPTSSLFFAVEKAVRSELYTDSSSGNTADHKTLRFHGSITVYCPETEQKIQISVSGLKQEEDVYVGINILAEILQKSKENICQIIAMSGGVLPSCFEDATHYLHIPYIADF